MATTQPAGPSPELIFDTPERLSTLGGSARAAIELDLFRAIGAGPGDVASLARECRASERGMRTLCDYLTIFGLLAKGEGRYRHTPTSALFLDPGSPACIASR